MHVNRKRGLLPFIYLDANIFVLLSPLPVDVGRSKTLLFKLPNHHAVEKETHWEKTNIERGWSWTET